MLSRKLPVAYNVENKWRWNRMEARETVQRLWLLTRLEMSSTTLVDREKFTGVRGGN